MRDDHASLTFPTLNGQGSISPTVVNGKTIPGLIVTNYGFQLGQAELRYGGLDPNTTKVNGSAAISIRRLVVADDIRIGLSDLAAVVAPPPLPSGRPPAAPHRAIHRST